MARVLKIHPAIGIARLGASKDDYFVGPEVPMQFDPPPDGYRDAANKLKRQGARFRVFVYEDAQPPRELTAAEAEISWTVELANTKAASKLFVGAGEPDAGRRNDTVADRSKLVLSAPATSVKAGEPKVDLTSTKPFLDHPNDVILGRLIPEDGGTLVVLGGHGRAETPTNAPLDNASPNGFANHDGWWDDVSDGPVSAKVTFKDGSPAPPVASAWVIVAPPKFAPALQSPVTLYDTLRQVAVNRGLLPNPLLDPAFQPSFTADIYPILRRASLIHWVYANNKAQPKTFHKFDPAAANSATLFPKLAIPAAKLGQPGSGLGNMPMMWSDAYWDLANPQRKKPGTLTPLQYGMMKAWRDGKFKNDWTGAPPPPEPITPSGLDRAALEPCVGGAFFPGIETSWMIRDTFAFSEAFRLDPTALSPGDLTKQMAIPWQSDFLDCAIEGAPPLAWWPAQRPINVWTNTAAPPVDWARSFAGGATMSVEDLIKDGDRLGLILEDNGDYLEKQRIP